MYAVMKDYEEVKDIFFKIQKENPNQILDVAAINSPTQFVISGDAAVVHKVISIRRHIILFEIDYK